MTESPPIVGAIAPIQHPAIVTFEGLVARDSAGRNGSARGTLQGISATLGSGIHVFLGAPEDGTLALCEVVVGARKPLRGNVLILGAAPFADPMTRARTGALLATADIPEAPTVRASVALALTALNRPKSEVESLLADFGLTSLLARRPSALTFAETRAVEFAIALHQVRVAPAPSVLVLFEPFADIATSKNADDITAALQTLRDQGACVIIATSSPADTRKLADVVWLLHGGTLLRSEHPTGRLFAPVRAEIAAWFAATDGPALRTMAAHIAANPAIKSAVWDDSAEPGRPRVLRVRGDSRDACALALIDAAASLDIAIQAITSSAADLPQVRGVAIAMHEQSRAMQAAMHRAALARAAMPQAFAQPQQLAEPQPPPPEGEPQ